MTQSSPNEATPTDHPAGAHAIEVVTMLGDSVVGVDHLEPGRPAPSRRATLALFLAGALMLAVSALAFARGVRTAAANRAAYDKLVEVDRVAAHHFRPERLGIGWDLLAFGGLAGGVIALGLGLWRRSGRDGRAELTAGRGPDVDVALAAVDAERVPLVRAAADRTLLTVAPGMDARVRAGGVATPLADLIARGDAVPAVGLAGGWELPLPAGGSARLTAGPATVVIRSVAAPAARLAGLAGAIDRKAVAFLAGSALVHAIALLILQAIPPTSRSLAVDLGSGEEHPTMLVSLPPVDPEPEPADDGGDEDDDTAGAELAMSGAAGTAGTPDAEQATGRNRVARRADTPQLSRAMAIEMARREGILGGDLAAQFRALAGSADFSSGWDKVDEYGFGGSEGNGAGDFGGGGRGDGPGGGGPRDDVYRIGTDLWKHPGPGQAGDGVIRLRDHTGDKPRPRISLGEATGPDKETIRRYVRRHLDRIRYLYEKQLLVDPALAGTVVVVFTISPEGVVLQATGKGMGGHVIEGQIAEVFKSIAFPKTRNGGVIVVSYPINLHSRG